MQFSLSLIHEKNGYSDTISYAKGILTFHREKDETADCLS